MRAKDSTRTFDRTLSRLRRAALLAATLVCATSAAWAELPEGSGRAEAEKLCIGCHDLAKSVSVRQDRAGWATTLTKMITLGLKAPDKDLRTILEYLTKNYPAAELPPVNVNKARAIQLESRLSLKRSEASAIIRWRKANGDFQSIEELKEVPGLDFAKIEAKKDRLVF